MENKKRLVLIHGATNTSNFGDVLFASLFYNKLSKNKDIEVAFLEIPKYGVGTFVRRELNYEKHVSLWQQLHADTLVYMSGGYFGDDKKSAKLTLRRWLRYILIGLWMRMRKKNIYICGVGGGPLYNKWLRKNVVNIIDSAKYVSMREEQSAEYFRNNGVKNQINVTTDTALIISNNMLPVLDAVDKQELLKLRGSKKMFIHISKTPKDDELFARVIVPAINSYLLSHPEYGLVVGMDGEYDYDDVLTLKQLTSTNIYKYRYHSAWQLCSLLNEMDCIITMKLHVGIIGAALGKSVISFPIHQHKTMRFYNQIGEGERCVQLTTANTEIATKQLERFAEKTISVPEIIRETANRNLTALEEI